MVDIRTVAATVSTNDDVARFARDGGAEGLWLSAERQSGGKGRHRRAWQSPPGNLHASTLVRPRRGDPPPATLALVAAVALDQLLGAHLDPGRLQIKWPNDVLVDGAKISGILLEGVEGAVVIGFGVNLRHHPDDLDRPTTSLAVAGGGAPEASAFLADLAEAFGHWLARWRDEGLAPVRRRWMERAHPIGTPLGAAAGDGETIEGLFDGLADDGALRLRLADSTVHVMHAGDVFLI